MTNLTACVIALLFVISLGQAAPVPIVESKAGYGNHFYKTENIIFYLDNSWQPGTTQIYHLISPFSKNFDNIFTTKSDEVRKLIATGCWINDSAKFYIYTWPALGTRPLYQFARKNELISGIGDHLVTTDPLNVSKERYNYMGLLGFVNIKDK